MRAILKKQTSYIAGEKKERPQLKLNNRDTKDTYSRR